jgi:formylglycine-generating enzyme required for sulfatase activity
MKRILLITLVLTWVSAGYANEEITVELPGGATLEMVWIEPGTFMMGSPSSEVGRFDAEGPQHKVTISQGFYLGKYELTQRQWESVMGTTPWSGLEYVQANATHPAVYISRNNIQEFFGRQNAAAGEEIYRLPTEAELEYACRAGTDTRWSFGDGESQLGDYAWYHDNTWDAGLKYAQSVGTKLPNPWGLYDMHGNVWEWCQDWHGNYSSGVQTDPTGPSSGDYRIARNGCFDSGARRARSAYRWSAYSHRRNYKIGVRLLRMGPKLTNVTPESWGKIKADQ